MFSIEATGQGRDFEARMGRSSIHTYSVEVFRGQRPPSAQGTAAVAFWAGLNASQAQETHGDSRVKAKLERPNGSKPSWVHRKSRPGGRLRWVTICPGGKPTNGRRKRAGGAGSNECTRMEERPARLEPRAWMATPANDSNSCERAASRAMTRTAGVWR